MPSGPTLAVVGAGNRGAVYAELAARRGARVVAVADPRPERREALAARHGIDPSAVVHDWHALAARPRVADAVVVATQDRDHVEPAVAFAGLGYDILLEKPMAPSESEARRIVEAAESADVLLAVCHVLRYTPYTRALMDLLASGAVGEVVSVEHLEPVGWWHYAHSFVRGNWRKEAESTSMLMAKSCHDIDWISAVVGRPARRVASFGSLRHFRPEERPPGAGERCTSCAVEPQCPYSATRLYLGCLGDPARERWPLSVVTSARTREGVLDALRSGPYGRCVYSGDNDVVDHQVVSLEFDEGVTASFTMTAFTPYEHRRTRVFGTRGCVEGDGQSMTVHDFVSGRRRTVSTETGDDASAAGGHGGGDDGLVAAFLEALRTGDRSHVLTGPRESLAGHRVVWAAERSRREGVVVEVPRDRETAVR